MAGPPKPTPPSPDPRGLGLASLIREFKLLAQSTLGRVHQCRIPSDAIRVGATSTQSIGDVTWTECVHYYCGDGTRIEASRNMRRVAGGDVLAQLSYLAVLRGGESFGADGNARVRQVDVDRLQQLATVAPEAIVFTHDAVVFHETHAYGDDWHAGIAGVKATIGDVLKSKPKSTSSAQLIPVTGECVECKQMVIVDSGKGHAPTCKYRPAQRTLVRALKDENGHIRVVDEPVAPKPDRMFRKIDLDE